MKNFDKTNLRQARLVAGLSLEEASKGICSVSLLSLIERGQRTASPDMLKQIHERVGIFDSDPSLRAESVELIQGCLALDNDSSEHAKEWLPKIKSDSERMILQGLIAEAEGNLPLAVALLEQAVMYENTTATALNRAFLSLVRVERDQGNFYAAVYWGEQNMAKLQSAIFDTSSLQWEAKATLVSVYLQLGDFAKASALVKSRPDAIETTWDAVVQLWSSGSVAYHQGNFDLAANQTRGAAELISTLNKKMSQSRLTYSAIFMSIAAGHAPTQRDLEDLDTVLNLFRSEKYEKDIAETLVTKAFAYQALLDFEKATQFSTESIEYCDKLGGSKKAELLAANALVMQNCGESTIALEALEKAAEAMAKQPKSRLSARVWTQMAEIYENIGQTAKALECYRHSSEAAGLSLKREAARASA